MTEYLVVTLMLSCYGAILEVGNREKPESLSQKKSHQMINWKTYENVKIPDLKDIGNILLMSWMIIRCTIWSQILGSVLAQLLLLLARRRRTKFAAEAM